MVRFQFRRFFVLPLVALVAIISFRTAQSATRVNRIGAAPIPLFRWPDMRVASVKQVTISPRIANYTGGCGVQFRRSDEVFMEHPLRVDEFSPAEAAPAATVALAAAAPVTAAHA